MPFSFKSSHLVSSISVMTLAVGLAFSQSTTQKSLAQTTPTQINGAGALFLSNLFTGSDGWFETYGAPPPAVNPNVRLNYAGVSSGVAVSAFLSQTPPSGTPTVPSPLSFAATAAPLSTAQLQQYQQSVQPSRGAVVQVPVVGGAVTLAYNPGLRSGIRLSRTTYARILNGDITNWNDSRITADNNGQRVSANLPIRVVYRSDSSGTTFILTQHLDTVAGNIWNRGVGNTVSWPSTFIGVEGNSGVVNRVNSTAGAIGYVDNPALSGTNLRAALLQNQAGNYVAPTSATTSAALAGASDSDPLPNIITVNVPNPSGATAYPIVGVGYQLFYGRYTNSAVSAGIRGFIDWALGSAGDTIASNRGYGPLPANLETAVRSTVNNGVR